MEAGNLLGFMFVPGAIGVVGALAAAAWRVQSATSARKDVEINRLKQQLEDVTAISEERVKLASEQSQAAQKKLQDQATDQVVKEEQVLEERKRSAIAEGWRLGISIFAGALLIGNIMFFASLVLGSGLSFEASSNEISEAGEVIGKGISVVSPAEDSEGLSRVAVIVANFNIYVMSNLVVLIGIALAGVMVFLAYKKTPPIEEEPLNLRAASAPQKKSRFSLPFGKGKSEAKPVVQQPTPTESQPVVQQPTPTESQPVVQQPTPTESQHTVNDSEKIEN